MNVISMSTLISKGHNIRLLYLRMKPKIVTVRVSMTSFLSPVRGTVCLGEM